MGSSIKSSMPAGNRQFASKFAILQKGDKPRQDSKAAAVNTSQGLQQNGELLVLSAEHLQPLKFRRGLVCEKLSFC
jgi:hypothetical protein